MRFWPFGKEKEDSEVDRATRVVTASCADGSTVRAKLNLHFVDVVPQAAADEAADAAAVALRALFSEAPGSHELLGREAELSAGVGAMLPLHLPRARSIEVVALHVVGEADPTATPRPAPTTQRPASSPGVAPTTRRPGSSPGIAPSRRHSSSQMLAVGEGRLVLPNSTPEAAGIALAPLLSDASTRVLVGVLRAYDLLAIRKIAIDEATGDLLADIVPRSSVALGRFTEDRAEEVSRWQRALGDEKLAGLAREARVVVCFFLHTSLAHEEVDVRHAITVLEGGAAAAFPNASPLSDMPRYIHSVDTNPAEGLARAVEKLLGQDAELTTLPLALTPLLASLQDDMGFAATQVKLSVTGSVRPPPPS